MKKDKIINDCNNVTSAIEKVKNFNDLDDNDIIFIGKTIKIIHEFNDKISNYAEKIFYDKFYKTVSDWLEILSEKDIKISKLENFKDKNKMLIYCYDNKTFYNFDSPGLNGGWIMGAYGSHSNRNSVEYSFSECSNFLIVGRYWSYQQARFGHIPFIDNSKVFKINYKTGKVHAI